jgi:hypothetical protein
MLVTGIQLPIMVPPSGLVPMPRQMRKLFTIYSLQALLGALSSFQEYLDTIFFIPNILLLYLLDWYRRNHHHSFRY